MFYSFLLCITPPPNIVMQTIHFKCLKIFFSLWFFPLLCILKNVIMKNKGKETSRSNGGSHVINWISTAARDKAARHCAVFGTRTNNRLEIRYCVKFTLCLNTMPWRHLRSWALHISTEMEVSHIFSTDDLPPWGKKTDQFLGYLKTPFQLHIM
jgi:hypothetical protein